MLVVVLYDLLIGHVPVVGQYTAVCVLAVENVKLLSLLLALPLHDEAAMLHVLETLEGERLHVVLLFSSSPSILDIRVDCCCRIVISIRFFIIKKNPDSSQWLSGFAFIVYLF